MDWSRRSFLTAAGAAARLAAGDNPKTAVLDRCACATRPAVALTTGGSRRKLVHDALAAIDDQILPVLRVKRSIFIKPNVVTTTNQLACTHPDTLCGILDYLAPRCYGPVVIAESSAESTLAGFSNYRYAEAVREFRSLGISFIDLNEEGLYQLIHVPDRNLRAAPVRLASRFFDPNAFIISAANMKTHNVVVATLSVKNMVMGAPLHNRSTEAAWSDKRKFHEGVRNSNYAMFLSAQKLAPFWGAAVIDGFEGMEGDGPTGGAAVASGVAIASTDLLAADRVGLEVMGIDPTWVGYLSYCGQAGVGQYDLAQIDVRGAAPESVKRAYKLHRDIQIEKLWMDDLPDSPMNPRIG